MFASMYMMNDYIFSEVTRFSEKIAKEFMLVKCKLKKDGRKTKIHFSTFKSDLVVILEQDGCAYFLKKDHTLLFKRNKKIKTVIAEWNVFAEPFIISIIIQLKIYRLVKEMAMKNNIYYSHDEVFDATDKESMSILDGFYDNDKVEGEMENQMDNSIHTEPAQLKFGEIHDVISDQYHMNFGAVDESYLDIFDKEV